MYLEPQTIETAGIQNHDAGQKHGLQPAPDRLLHIIDESLGDFELNPGKIAKNLGMSRASLYRLTVPFGGVQRIITERPLTVAYDILTSQACKEFSISDLAFELGFNAESTFRRVYKDKYGISPKATKQATLAR